MFNPNNPHSGKGFIVRAAMSMLEGEERGETWGEIVDKFVDKEVERLTGCDTCEGKGTLLGSTPLELTCPVCGGTGKKRAPR